MQDDRTRGWTALAVVALVAVTAACGASGTRTGDGVSRTAVHATAHRDASTPVLEPIAELATPAPTAPVAASTTTTTPTIVPSEPGPGTPSTQPTAEPTVVSIAALVDAAFTHDDVQPCSDISAQSMSRGQLEVRRSGPRVTDLAVHYASYGADADHEVLPGQIVIPAGASSAVIMVDPRAGDMTAPRHVHRASALSIVVQGGAGYAPGPSASAAIELRFDIDVYGCSRRVPEGAPTGGGPVS